MAGFKNKKDSLKYGMMIRNINANQTVAQKAKNILTCLYRVFITFSNVKGQNIDKYR